MAMQFWIALVVCFVAASCQEEDVTKVTQDAVWGYAEFQTGTNFLKFSEDMYLSNDLFCLPYDEVDATCLPCTYSAVAPLSCPGYVQPFSDDFSSSTQRQLTSLRNDPCTCEEDIVCDLPEIVLGVPSEVELEDNLYAKVYRFESDSWEQGFVIKNKPIADFAPTIVVSTSTSFTTETIIASSNRDHIIVCPSHPLFGPGSNTFTYFISVEALRYSKSEILIELLETDETAGDRRDFELDSGKFYMENDQELGEGAYTRVAGDYFLNNHGIPYKTNSLYLFLHPFEECGVYSFHSEYVKSEGQLWRASIFLMVFTESELPTVGIRSVEYIHLRSTVHEVSGDSVLSFCPETTDEQNYIAVAIITDDGPWEVDFFLRKAENSDHIVSFPISDAAFSHVQIQERLGSAFLLRFPCANCTLNNDILDYVSRRNLMTAEFFPALVDPLPEEVSSEPDLLNQLALETDNYYYLRCVDRRIDSACGLLSVYPFGDFASPLIYPALEPVRSLSPLPSLVAQDLTYLFPTRADRLSLMTFLEVGDTFTITEERYETGELLFANPSPLHSQSFGTPPLKTYHISEMPLEPPSVCSFETFHPIYEFMSFLHSVLRAGQRSGRTSKAGNILDIDSRTANYWAYAMLWTREWQSCWDNGAALVNFGLRVTPLTNTSICAFDNPYDPCCNPRLEWSECCSSEGRSLLQYQWLPLDLNEDASESNCLDPECMETFATDFSELYRSAIVDSICVVNNEISSNISSIFSTCTGLYLGEQPEYGISCYDDDDCDELFDDPEAFCDLRAHKCVVDSESQQNAFLGCLIDRMGSFTTTLIYDELVEEGIADPSDSNGEIFLTVDLLREAVVDGDYRCLDDYGPMYDRHEYFKLVSQTTIDQNTCPMCDEGGFDIHCLTTFGCDAPTQCFDLSESCATNYAPVEPECESPDLVCNWDNSITVESDCTDDEYKCMYCYNSSYCVTFSADEDDCDSTSICVLLDGEVVWDVDEDDCEGRNTCEDGGYGSEDDCEDVGECHDVDQIFESVSAVAALYPELSDATSGVCITPLRPMNTPPCPLLRDNRVDTFDFTALRGCVRFSECQFLHDVGDSYCIHDPATEDDCVDNWGGTWLSLPIDNSKDCQNPHGLDDDEAPGYCWRLDNVDLLSPKEKDLCEDCSGGVATPPARWTKLKWGGGQSLKPSWRKTEMVAPYHYSHSSISFFALENLFEKAALGYENFILWSGETCLINPFLNYLDIASCDCSLDGAPSSNTKVKENPFTGFPITTPECRDELESDVIGTIWFCPGFDLKTGVISGIVTSLSDYVNGQLCFFSDILLASTSDFVGNRPSEPVTVTDDPNDLDPSPVRNQKGASVGIVLADGVSFVLNKNTQPVDWSDEAGGVQLTFTIDLNVFEDKGVPADYILDFGLEVVDSSRLKTQPDGEIELRPVDAEGNTVGQKVGNFYPESEDDERLPIIVDGILLDPFRYDESARIYPIARMKDWEEEDEDEALTTGETAMIGVFAGLYGVAFLVTFGILVMGFSSLTLSLFLLFFYVLAVFLFRTVFWALVAAGEYEETSAGYYILVEPPSFFILSVLTILIMSYAFIVAATNGQAEDKLGTYWCSWFVLQLFLFAVLCTCIGLMIGLDTNDTVIISCFGRESTVEENTTVRDIRIAYHSFVLFVAICCALIVIKLGRDLPTHDNKSTLQYLSALAGLAVVLTSALWLTYSIIDDPTPYFVIPLFFTEVPPLLLMSYLTFSSSQPGKGEPNVEYDL